MMDPSTTAMMQHQQQQYQQQQEQLELQLQHLKQQLEQQQQMAATHNNNTHHDHHPSLFPHLNGSSGLATLQELPPPPPPYGMASHHHSPLVSHPSGGHHHHHHNRHHQQHNAMQQQQQQYPPPRRESYQQVPHHQYQQQGNSSNNMPPPTMNVRHRMSDPGPLAAAAAALKDFMVDEDLLLEDDDDDDVDDHNPNNNNNNHTRGLDDEDKNNTTHSTTTTTTQISPYAMDAANMAQSRWQQLEQKTNLPPPATESIFPLSWNDIQVEDMLGVGGFACVCLTSIPKLTKKLYPPNNNNNNNPNFQDSILSDFSLESWAFSEMSLEDDEDSITEVDLDGEDEESSTAIVHPRKSSTTSQHSRTKPHSLYALKCLNRKVFSNSRQILTGASDLATETFLLSRLQHENILQLHGVSEGNFHQAYSEPMGYFIVLQVLDTTLENLLQGWRNNSASSSESSKKSKGLGSVLKRGLFSRTVPTPAGVPTIYQRLSTIALGIAKGMEFLHQHKVVFRDLKPSNCGLDSEGRLRLFDFGLARELTPSKHPSLHPSFPQLYEKGVAGSLRYMAPETILHQFTTLESDVFAFSLVLWELLTLKVPFEQLQTPQQYHSVVAHQKVRPSLKSIVIANDQGKVNNLHTTTMKRLLQQGWDPDWQQRPPFFRIRKMIDTMVSAYMEQSNPIQLSPHRDFSISPVSGRSSSKRRTLRSVLSGGSGSQHSRSGRSRSGRSGSGSNNHHHATSGLFTPPLLGGPSSIAGTSNSGHSRSRSGRRLGSSGNSGRRIRSSSLSNHSRSRSGRRTARRHSGSHSHRGSNANNTADGQASTSTPSSVVHASAARRGTRSEILAAATSSAATNPGTNHANHRRRTTIAAVLGTSGGPSSPSAGVKGDARTLKTQSESITLDGQEPQQRQQDDDIFTFSMDIE